MMTKKPSVFRYYHYFPTPAPKKQHSYEKKTALIRNQNFVLVPNLRSILLYFGLKVCNFYLKLVRKKGNLVPNTVPNSRGFGTRGCSH